MAIAAQETPIQGKIQYQKIKSGSIIKFNKTVNKTIFNGNLTSHNHLISDWNIANQNTKTIHIKEIFKKLWAPKNTSSETHISFKIYPAEKYQINQIITEIIVTIKIVWAATLFNIFIFLAQKYWEIRVVHAIENQLQSDNIKKVIGKLTDTAATASFHNLQTQNASVNWYALCNKFAIKIGIAIVKIVLIIGQFKAISSLLFFIFFIIIKIIYLNYKY